MEERSQCLRLAEAELSDNANDGRVPFTCRSQLGVVVPMPRLPLSSAVNRSVPAESVRVRSRPVPVPSPLTANRARGVEVPMPILPPLVVSSENMGVTDVDVAKLHALTVLFAIVDVAGFTKERVPLLNVTEVVLAEPNVVLPLTVKSPLMI